MQGDTKTIEWESGLHSQGHKSQAQGCQTQTGQAGDPSHPYSIRLVAPRVLQASLSALLPLLGQHWRGRPLSSTPKPHYCGMEGAARDSQVKHVVCAYALRDAHAAVVCSPTFLTNHALLCCGNRRPWHKFRRSSGSMRGPGSSQAAPHRCPVFLTRHVRSDPSEEGCRCSLRGGESPAAELCPGQWRSS